jgi:hypothetical protein
MSLKKYNGWKTREFYLNSKCFICIIKQILTPFHKSNFDIIFEINTIAITISNLISYINQHFLLIHSHY